jgi:hypothetical protein
VWNLRVFSQTKTSLHGASLTGSLYLWPFEKINKPAFWDSPTAIGEDFVNPWLCIGDFNFFLDQSKKLGGKPVASSSHCPFRGFIDQLGLVDLGFVGNPFTWCNNR